MGANDKVRATFHGADSCGRGVCAANAGHEFSCSVASGWADGGEWAEAFFQSVAERDRARGTAAALEAEVARLSRALQYLADHGTGHDLTPTVLRGGDYAWWSNYLTSADEAVRAAARAVLAS